MSDFFLYILVFAGIKVFIPMCVLQRHLHVAIMSILKGYGAIFQAPAGDANTVTQQDGMYVIFL